MKKVLLAALIGSLMTIGLSADPIGPCSGYTTVAAAKAMGTDGCFDQDKIYSNFSSTGTLDNWALHISSLALPNGTDIHTIDVSQGTGGAAVFGTGSLAFGYTISVSSDPQYLLWYIRTAQVSANIGMLNPPDDPAFGYDVVKVLSSGGNVIATIGVHSGVSTTTFNESVGLAGVKSLDVTETLTYRNAYVSSFTDTFTQSANSTVPEPGVIGMIGFGLLGLGWVARRRATR
jgi:hypothetical protein